MNADCDHPEDMRREHHSESKVRDDISGRYVFTYDAAQHTYRYHIIDWTQCAACGALLESGSKYEDRAEAHDFDENGECTVCNYVQASHTLHDWTEPGESESACYYLFLDDETHQKNVEYLLKCRVCGATTYTEGLPVNELHAFVDGVCACGYREDGGFGEPSEVCQHLYTYASPAPLGGDKATYIDETYHSRELDSVVLEIYCSDCGAYLSSGYDNTAGRTIKEEHAFTTKTATGAKCDCGYEIECTHTSVEKEEWDNYRYSDTYVDTGDGVNHTYIVSYTPEYTCLVCGVEWSGDTVVETRTEEHDPEWSDETICSDCGGTITPSEPEPEEPIEPECRHSHGFVKGRRDTAEPAYSLNDEQHATRYYAMVYWQCPDCGESWDESEATGYVVESNHTFENGFCTECGYINACQHDETGVESYIESIEVLSRDASGHTAVEHVFQRTVCNQCGQVLSEGSVENEVSGAHSYGESGTSARCEVCNWSRGCEHPQEKRMTETTSLGFEVGVVSCDESGHTMLEPIVDRTYCGICYDTLDEQYSTKEVEFEHYFLDGVCWMCGYACPHGHLNAETTVESVEYLPCSYDEHTVVRKTGTTQTCTDCGVKISYDVEETVATEPHRPEDESLIGSPCMDCGVNWHDHSCENYTRTWTDYTYDHYEHENGECYRVGRYARTNIFCSACEKMESYTLYDPDYRQQVPHEFSDYGVCFNCGYYNDGGNCSHADAYIDYYVDTVYELQETGLVKIVDNGDGTHSYTKYQMPHYYCPDCGYAYLGEVEAVEGYTEKHILVGINQCWYCGAYVQQCTHPNAVTETVAWYDTYEHADKDGHWYRPGACMEVFSCPDCGLEDFYDADTGLLEPHDWYNGACTICGYVNECAHENAEPYTETLLRGVKSYDADGHMAVYEEVSGKRCPDCLEVTEQPAERTEVTEAHKFDAYGACEVCGYVREDSGEEPACTHENTTETREELPAVYESVDDATHTNRVDAAVTVTCDDCGETVSEKTEQGTPATEAARI